MTRVGGPPARAVALAGAGVAALIASRGFGTPALAILGVGMVALPVIVTGLVWLAAAGLRVERRIEPARVAAGAPVRVRAERRGWAVRLGLDRVLQISTDPALGGAGTPQGVQWDGDADVWTLAAVRGDHQLAPVRAGISDPFGLAWRAREGAGDARLLVVPLAPRLDGAPRGPRSRGHGVRRRGAQSGFGELDRVRDYRSGDALSRVHWAQTAKRGRLQTKEMKAPEGTGRTTLILLDGAVPAGDDFETTVTAAAALARHFAERREPFAFAHTGRRPVRIGAVRATWSVVEMALAQIEPGGERTLGLALRAYAMAGDAPDAIIALTCAADAGLLAATAQARALGVAVTAVLAGPAAAASADLTAAGAQVRIVSGIDRVAASLSGIADRARVV